jgi:hypothetical protein
MKELKCNYCNKPIPLDNEYFVLFKPIKNSDRFEEKHYHTDCFYKMLKKDVMV